MTSEPKIYDAPSYSPPLYYSFALQLAKPLYRFTLWQRARHKPTYRQEIAQRFGREYPERPDSQALIWCHAVSLGETNTIAPLLNELLARGYVIWLTNTTQTGYDRAGELFALAISQGQLVHTFVPVDTTKVVTRFLDVVRPDAAVFVETELWPVMLSLLNKRDIPAVLVNARLSASSFAKYQRFSSLSRNMMNNLSLVITQNSDSAKRFRQLRLDRQKIRVAESLKWSAQANKPASIKADVEKDTKDNSTHQSAVDINIDGRPVWVAASTHEGEEAIVIEAHRRLITQSQPNLFNSLLILVPRHPERFDSVAQLLKDTDINFVRRSQGDPITPDTQVYLADTMGELMQWYALADVAFVGGSLVDVGGHNPIEAASVGTPIIMGPYTQTCKLLVDSLLDVGALISLQSNSGQLDKGQTNNNSNNTGTVGNDDSSDKGMNEGLTEDLLRSLQEWLATPILATKAGERGQELALQKQGAALQQLQMMQPLLPPAPNEHKDLSDDKKVINQALVSDTPATVKPANNESVNNTQQSL